MNDYNFGNFICMLRERKGLTQQDVADILGVTPAAVSKWENGSSKPRVEMLFRLAKLLGVRTEELLAGEFLPEEGISDESARRINERYEYLTKVESYASTKVKLKRLVSAFIDLSSAGVLVYLVMFLAQKIVILAGGDEGTEAACCVLSGLFAFFVFFGLHDIIGFGRSLGKRIMGLIILDKKTGEDAGKKQIFSRNITTFGATMVPGVLLAVNGFVMLFSGQAIGDRTANTVVVEKTPRKKEIHTVQNTEVDLQKINAYKPSTAPSKRLVIVLISIIAAIVTAGMGLVVYFFVGDYSEEIIDTDITKYEEHCAVTYCNVSDFMPSLETLTDYTDISYAYKTMIYSKHMGFKSEGWILFVEYDSTVYAEKKTEILNNTTFLEEPVVIANYYRLPVTAFSYKNYQMKIVPDTRYRPYSCDSFGLIGFDDANNCIVYCYHYSYDYDYIAEQGDDLEAEMIEFMDDVFVWKEDIVAQPTSRNKILE